MNRLIIFFIVLLAAMTRLIPHPPNFTPIIAIGLVSGAYITNRYFCFFIPICAMFISDIFLGFQNLIYWVYGSLLLIPLLGMLLKSKVNIVNCILGCASGSIIFFIITNFGVWISSSYYPKTIEGILTCYTMALPFFANTLTSSLLYSAIIFSGSEYIVRKQSEHTSKTIL